MYELNLTDYDREVYEKELRAFLPDRVIDCHAHIWKNSFDWAGDVSGTSTWTLLVADELPDEKLVETYREMLPGKQVTPLIFGSTTHRLDQVNRYVKETSEKYGFPNLFRCTYDMSPEELEEGVRRTGSIGLKPYLTSRPSYIPSGEIRIFDFIPPYQLEAANRNGWVVMLHIARSRRLRDSVNVGQIMEIEEKYPDLKLVVAHVGRAYAKEDIGDAFNILKNTKNILFDFTANVCDDAIRACLEAVGPDRLMFGTDLPIAKMHMYRVTENGVYYNIVPRGEYGDVSGDPHMRESDEYKITTMMYEQIRAMKRCAAELKLRDGDVEKIFYKNADKLFRNYQ